MSAPDDVNNPSAGLTAKAISVVPLSCLCSACIETCLHSGVSHFALWLDSLLRFRGLKLFDDIFVKQSAAIMYLGN